VPAETKDPEESVMDVIAGELGFFDEIVRPYLKSSLSFSAISELRNQLCPEASVQASIFGFVQASLQPCLFIEAELALKKSETVEVRHQPIPVLRAVRVTPNDAARQLGLFIPRNMRVPTPSVLSRVFDSELTCLEAVENLSWWTSDGKCLPEQSVHMEARRTGQRSQGLVTPTY
jgi:hypothetical protein